MVKASERLLSRENSLGAPGPDDLRLAVNHKPEKSRAPTEVNEPPGSATMRKWVGSHNSRPEE